MYQLYQKNMSNLTFDLLLRSKEQFDLLLDKSNALLRVSYSKIHRITRKHISSKAITSPFQILKVV
jgi:hypothetical protein